MIASDEMVGIVLNMRDLWIIRSTHEDIEQRYYGGPQMWVPIKEATIFRSFEAGEEHLDVCQHLANEQRTFEVVSLYVEMLEVHGIQVVDDDDDDYDDYHDHEDEDDDED